MSTLRLVGYKPPPLDQATSSGTTIKHHPQASTPLPHPPTPYLSDPSTNHALPTTEPHERLHLPRPRRRRPQQIRRLPRHRHLSFPLSPQQLHTRYPPTIANHTGTTTPDQSRRVTPIHPTQISQINTQLCSSKILSLFPHTGQRQYILPLRIGTSVLRCCLA